MFDFFWVPALSFCVAVLAILLLRPLAAAGGLLDRPDTRKRHKGEVPLVGGIGIIIATWVGYLLFFRVHGYYVALIGGITFLGIVGLVDDRVGIQPVGKLVLQLLAAIMMTSWGNVYLSSLGDLLGRREIELINWGIPLTVFAVVAVVNALNMVDGLDGLAGGLSFFVFAWYAYLAGEVGNLAAQRLCVIVCGALLGFLLFNMRNPLRGRNTVFLGDSGSLALGFAIVWFAVELSQGQYNGGRHVPPVVMLWVVGFILIDLLAVVVRRAVKGKNPLSADRTHVHHVLLRLGVGQDAIVWVILASNALLGLVGVYAWKRGIPEQYLFIAFLLLTFMHLLAMRNAWKILRLTSRVISRTRQD